MTSGFDITSARDSEHLAPPVDAPHAQDFGAADSAGGRPGKIEVSSRAIATVAGRAVAQCYGVVGIAATHPRLSMVETLRPENYGRGVDVRFVHDHVSDRSLRRAGAWAAHQRDCAQHHAERQVRSRADTGAARRAGQCQRAGVARQQRSLAAPRASQRDAHSAIWAASAGDGRSRYIPAYYIHGGRGGAPGPPRRLWRRTSSRALPATTPKAHQRLRRARPEASHSRWAGLA